MSDTPESSIQVKDLISSTLSDDLEQATSELGYENVSEATVSSNDTGPSTDDVDANQVEVNEVLTQTNDSVDELTESTGLQDVAETVDDVIPTFSYDFDFSGPAVEDISPDQFDISSEVKPDGIEVLPNGEVVLSNGAELLPNGDVKLANGDVIQVQLPEQQKPLPWMTTYEETDPNTTVLSEAVTPDHLSEAIEPNNTVENIDANNNNLGIDIPGSTIHTVGTFTGGDAYVGDSIVHDEELLNQQSEELERELIEERELLQEQRAVLQDDISRSAHEQSQLILDQEVSATEYLPVLDIHEVKPEVPDPIVSTEQEANTQAVEQAKESQVAQQTNNSSDSQNNTPNYFSVNTQAEATLAKEGLTPHRIEEAYQAEYNTLLLEQRAQFVNGELPHIQSEQEFNQHIANQAIDQAIHQLEGSYQLSEEATAALVTIYVTKNITEQETLRQSNSAA